MLKLCALKLWTRRWQELGKAFDPHIVQLYTHCHTLSHTLSNFTHQIIRFKWLHQREKQTSSSCLWFLCDGSALSDPIGQTGLCNVLFVGRRCVYKGWCNDQIHRLVPFWHPIYLEFLMRPPVHDTNDWDISGRHRAFQSNLTTLIRINWHLIKIFVLESKMCLCSLRDRFPSDRC